MKTSIGTWLSAIAVLGMAIPVQALDSSERRATGSTVVSDVALTADGELTGVVVGKNGQPLAGKPVQVLHNQDIVAEIRSDANGRYTIQGLRNGVHVVRTVNGRKICRFWSADTAPPVAHRGLLLTSDSTIIRGQDGCGECCGEGCNDCCGPSGGFFSGASAGSAIGVGLFAGAIVAVAVSVSDNTDPPAATTPPPSSP